MKAKNYFIGIILTLFFMLSTSNIFSQKRYSGSKHTSSHGGHYSNGRGSSHKGGHYKNSSTGNHYGKHK